MAYTKSGYPTELANKVGHIKLIQDPMIQRLIESFEDHRPTRASEMPPISGTADLSSPSALSQVITIDGGHQAVPNVVRPERQVGFIQVVVQLLKFETLDYLEEHPMADPRDVHRMLGRFTHHVLAALPLVGVHVSGLTVRDSIREAVHRFLLRYDLYPALAYLAYRQWEPVPRVEPSMHCYACGEEFVLPRHQLTFECSRCAHTHKLSDYLGLCDRDSEDRSTEEAVSNFRSALEALAVFALVIKFMDHETIMGRTLFLLDGPLILRAQLSRLVEPIRDLIEHQRARGRSIYLAGVEKNGVFRDFADVYGVRLEKTGDYLIPTVRYLTETINGRVFDPKSYRNRVNYGAKLVARVGPHHVLALNVPTGRFTLEPSICDLCGVEEILRALSRLRSYAYENALIPIVLANNAASISNRPSSDLLAQFVDLLMKGPHG